MFMCATFFAKAQSIIFTRDTLNLNLVDTNLKVVDKIVPEFIVSHKVNLPQNTIFFNGSILFESDTISTFYCNWAFFQNLIVNHSIIKESVNIDSTPADLLHLKHSTFSKSIKIKDCKISNFAFSNNKLYGKGYFINLNLESSLFDSTYFNKAVFFSKCTFANSNLTSIFFVDNCIFNDCEFGNVSFAHSTFNKTFDLSNISLKGILNLDSVCFKKNLILSSLITTSQTNITFFNTVFSDTLDLSYNPSLTNIIDLTKANFSNHKCALILNGTDISKIRLDYQYFKLAFKSRNDQNEISKNDKEILFEALLKNFREHGQNDSYELLDIEYKDFKNEWFKLPHWWNCYGYHKEWIFYWVLGFLIIFTSINYVFLHDLMQIYLPVKGMRYVEMHGIDRIWFSFVYTFVIFFSFSLKIDRIKLEHKIGTLYILIVYAIGLICLAYMANFVLQK